MKQLLITLFCICSFLPINGMSTGKTDIGSLKKGDWFELECTYFNIHSTYGKNQKPWSVEGKRQAVFQIRVLEKEDNHISLSCKLKRILNIFEYKDSYLYYDTNYPLSSNHDDIHHLLTNDSLVVGVNLKERKIENVSYSLNKTNITFDSEMIVKGFLKHGFPRRSVSVIKLNAKELFDNSVISYLRTSLSENKAITSGKHQTYSHLSYGDWNIWNEMRITKASFAMPSNVKIICKISGETNSLDLKLNINQHTEIKPTLRDGDRYYFSFYIPNPQLCRLYLNKRSISLPLTPNDTLELELDERSFPENILFSSSGSGACKYIYERNSDYYDHYGFRYNGRTMLEIADIVDKKLEKYEVLFSKYKSQMPVFWRASFQLDLHYWMATELFVAVNKMMEFNDFEDKLSELQKYFESKHLSKVTPMLDYLYSSGHYHFLLEEYAKYQKHSISKNNFSTNVLDLNFEQKLLLNNMIFRGYPEYYSNSRVLCDYIEERPLVEAQKSFDAFMTNCKDEKLSGYLQYLYQQMEVIQAGQSIKDLNLSILSGMKLKDEADGYILLNINRNANLGRMEYGILEAQDSIFKNLGLEDRAQIFVVRDIKQKKNWVDKDKEFNTDVSFYFHTDWQSLFEECQKLRIGNFRYMLLRNEGTIIHNNVKSGTGTLGASELYNILQEDLNKPVSKNNQADTRRLALAILLTLLLSGLASWGIFKVRTRQIAKKEEAKRRLAELELKAIRSQMNPHFLFNALSSIQHLINKNAIESANKYLSQFADMMRQVLNNSEKQLVPLADELILIQNYLELEQLRIPFKFDIIIDAHLKIEEEEIPGMLIQPFVENAVVHGIAPNRDGFIAIKFSKNTHFINCQVIDDGIGIKKRSIQRKGNGKAIKIIQERINIVNSHSDQSTSVQISDRSEKEDCSGTIVNINIPI